MIVVADVELALDNSLFPPEIQLRRVRGRSINRSLLQDANALLVRSITVVDAKLLHDTPVRFVGTATAGTDHLDIEYLQECGISYCSAAGCNANAVIDYCMTGLAQWLLSTGRQVQGLEVGIVGAGHTGSELARRLTRLGCQVLMNDPPLQASGIADTRLEFVSLSTISKCHVVSLHVPYIFGSKFPTHLLIDGEFLEAMPEQSLLINSCRGGVVDEAACLRHLLTRSNCSAVIDVWKGEPEVDAKLVAAATVATPHIAGYSNKAKKGAAAKVQTALLNFLAIDQFSDTRQINPGPFQSSLDEAVDLNYPDNIWKLPTEVLRLTQLSDRFKSLVRENQNQSKFDSLRSELRQRREFSEIQLESHRLSAVEQQTCQALGFCLDTDQSH